MWADFGTIEIYLQLASRESFTMIPIGLETVASFVLAEEEIKIGERETDLLSRIYENILPWEMPE